MQLYAPGDYFPSLREATFPWKTAIEGVFYDERAITVEDRDYAEERFVTLGMDSFGRVLVVAYHSTEVWMKSGLFPRAWLNLTSAALTKRTKL